MLPVTHRLGDYSEYMSKLPAGRGKAIESDDVALSCHERSIKEYVLLSAFMH